MEGRPPGPDEAILQEQIRHIIKLMFFVALANGLAQAAVGLALGSPRMVALGVVFGVLAVWIMTYPRWALSHRSVAVLVTRSAVVASGVMVVAAVLQPFTVILAAIGLLIPL